MVGETNAAIEGALAGGATEVLVNDSHGCDVQPASRSRSIRRAVVSRARRRGRWSRAPDRTRGFDVALFVGYHARAGHPRGTIAHTYTGAPVETRLDGRPTGEYGINAMVLGAWGVPVGLVTGDDDAGRGGGRLAAVGGTRRRQGRGPARGRLGPSLEARDRVRAGAERAVRRATPASSGCSTSDRRSSSRSTTGTRGEADHAAIVPGAERFGDTGVRFTPPTPRPPIAASWPGCGWPASSADGGARRRRAGWTTRHGRHRSATRRRRVTAGPHTCLAAGEPPPTTSRSCP